MEKLIAYICDYLLYILISGIFTAFGLFATFLFYENIFFVLSDLNALTVIWSFMWFGQFFWFLYLLHRKRNNRDICIVLIPIILLPIIFNLDSFLMIVGIMMHVLSSLMIARLVYKIYTTKPTE